MEQTVSTSERARASLEPALPLWLIRELRSDQAGEAGAVQIYRGILAVSRDPGVREFAARHLDTESGHLVEIESILPARCHSRLLPLWKTAGWVTGALPAIFGPAAVYTTIDAVETFVDHHYSEQIDALADLPELASIRSILERCRADELEHRDEAREAGSGHGRLARLWAWLVGTGSAVAVVFARRI